MQVASNVFLYDHVGFMLLPWTDMLMLGTLRLAHNSGNCVAPLILKEEKCVFIIMSVYFDGVNMTVRLVSFNHNSTYLFASDNERSYEKQ